jgi:hypothetical protein
MREYTVFQLGGKDAMCDSMTDADREISCVLPDGMKSLILSMLNLILQNPIF